MNNFTLRTIVIALSMVVCWVATAAQSRQVAGVVKDASGPVIGANVVIKGTTKGVSTDASGAFSIEVSPGETITVTSLGYTPVEQQVGDRARIEITLAEDTELIEELVVVGYGAQRKVDLTGAVSSVDTKDMLAALSTNIGDLLRGRVAGMSVTSTSGRPGSAPSIMIRGRRSLKDGQSTPLYIVDGVTVDGTEFASINPNDVESISVLKDGAAQSIYGARAANGVILVQTKRAKSGDGVVNFDSKIGVQTLWRNFDFYSPMEWYDMKAEGVANYMNVARESLTPDQVLGSEIMVDAYNNRHYTDWEKLMLKPALNQEYNLGFRGGTDRLRTSIGVGYFNQDGMLRTGSGYNRFNARVNVKKWLTVGANVSFARTKRLTEDGQFSDWVGAPPLAQPYLPDGSLRDWMNAEDLNPLYLQAHNNGEEVSELGRYTGYVEIRPFKGFSYRLNASYSARNQERGGYTDRQYPSVGSMASLQYGNYRRELIDNIINYQVPFNNEDHNLLLTGVSSYDNLRNTGLGLAASDISVDRDWNMIADGEFSDAWRGPTSNEDDDYGYDENLVLAFIGRLNYSYKDRYLLQASIARNGSSRFGQNNKWASLPSVSAGWRISEENFMQNVKAVDNLKLRLSYGQVGNQGGIPGFTTTPLANSKPMEFGDLPVMGYLPGEVMVNPFLKWETSITWNVGVDFSLFDSRLNGTVELYNTNTEDLLVERQIVSSLGYSKMWDNLGLSRTQGYEVSLAYDIFRKTDFRWSVSTNVGFSRNKIIRIDDGVDANGNPLPDEANNWFPGHPIKVYRDYYFDGIYQLDDFLDLGNGQWEMLHDIDTDGDGYGDTHVIPYQTNPAPGMIRVRDRDGNGKIDTDDRYIRPTEPTLIYAFTTNMQWKGFDLMADFYGTGGSLTRNPLLNTTANGTLRGRYNGIKVDYWTPENPSNRWPRPNALQNPSLNGSAAIQDSDYIRLRTLALGYTLPSNLTEKLEIDMVRVSVTATNLWTKTDFLSYSPEYSASGYPEPRQFIFGLNVTF